MKLQIFIVKLLFLGAFFIISNENLHLLVVSERELFFNIYFGWLNDLSAQMIDVTGYVIQFKWLPE